jgi:hypothetical protein
MLVFGLCNNPLGLVVHDNFHVVFVLGLCHGNPLGLGVLCLGGDDLGDSGAGVQRSASTAALQTCPWSCSVTIMVQMLGNVNLLELVTCNHLVSKFLLLVVMGQMLRVVNCQSPRTMYLLPPHSIFLDILKAYWGSCGTTC